MASNELFAKFDEVIQKINELKSMTECAYCKEELDIIQTGLAELKNVYNIIKEYNEGQRVKNEKLDKVRETVNTIKEVRKVAEERYPKVGSYSEDKLGVKQLLNEIKELRPDYVLRELGVTEITELIRIPSPINNSNTNSNDTMLKDLFPVGIPPLPPIPYGVLKMLRNE